MNAIAKNNIDTLNTDHDLNLSIARELNLSIARELVADEVLMSAVDLTANNAEQRPQDVDEIADAIRGIVSTLVAAAAGSTIRHPIARIVYEVGGLTDADYDPREIAAEVAWSVTMI